MSPLDSVQETATCPRCGLHQYAKGSCPRCHESLGIDFYRLDFDHLDEALLNPGHSPTPNAVGRALRQMRQRRGLSQERLARVIGPGNGSIVGLRSYLSRIECGHVRPPLSTLLRITRALGLSAIILRFDHAPSVQHPGGTRRR